MRGDGTTGRTTEKFTVEFHLDEGYIHVIGVGDIGIGDVREHMQVMHSHPLFRPGLSSIIDLTDARLQGDYELARQFHGFVKSFQDLRGEVRWAFVVPWDLNYGLARMMAALAEDLIIEMKAFRTLGEARDWVKRA